MLFVARGSERSIIMSRVRLVLAIALLAACAAPARAADMPPFFQAPPLPVQEFASGWYLRGDLGYRLNSIDGASSRLAPDITGTSIDDSWSVGGGFGYKAGWFRGDVTADWSNGTKFIGNTTVPTDYRMNVEAVTALANLYLDLGTWYGFTPYIGAGAGVSWLRTGEVFSISYPVDNLPKEAHWNFAWAAMAGVAYNFTPSLLLDVNYRYLQMGDAITRGDVWVNQVTVKDLSSHEFRVGIRYNIN
jgi:opacity protein-like surface antigen